MKMKLLIATTDRDYADHLSSYLSDRYANTFEVSITSQRKRFDELLETDHFDTALLDYEFANEAELNFIRLPLILAEDGVALVSSRLTHVRKYQRISSIVGNMWESFAALGLDMRNFGRGGRIIAVWSPVGGVGKTAVALAYATNRVSLGKRVVYLNMENFASIPAYFKQDGKSISKAFEKLASKDTNIQMLFTGIRQQDSNSGVYYFCAPENYEDMNILTEENIHTILDACAHEVDDLVVDLSGQYNANMMKIFDMAQFVMIVTDSSDTSQAKLHQFVNQHNAFAQIKEKIVQVNNKGAKNAEIVSDIVVNLPTIPNSDCVSVFRKLASNSFDF